MGIYTQGRYTDVDSEMGKYMTYPEIIKTYPVTIIDPNKGQVIAMNHFVRNSELSILTVEETDISDVSMKWDMIYRYIFEKEKDALMFALRFDGKMR